MSTMNIDRSPVPDYRARLALQGRVHVVLGGGNGIGRQVVHALAQLGAKVVCVDRDPDLAVAIAEEAGAIPLCADITRRDDMERLFAEARVRAGPVRGVVDIVGMPHIGPLEKLDDSLWKSQFDLVLNHAFLATQIGGKAIAKAGGGAMVFVGSMAGIASIPGQAAYGAAKAALHHLVECVGREFGATGVRVNAVAPGFVRTPRLNAMLNEEDWAKVERFIPLGSAADPSEIAAAILFLASDLASHVTGHVLSVDGGASGFLQPFDALRS